MSVARKRSYHDLSADEKKRYDRLRDLARRLRDPGGVRAKRCGSRHRRMIRLNSLADAMLGIHVVDDGFVLDEGEKRKPWTGSTTSWAPGARP